MPTLARSPSCSLARATSSRRTLTGFLEPQTRSVTLKRGVQRTDVYGRELLQEMAESEAPQEVAEREERESPQGMLPELHPVSWTGP